ncbi:MAG: hypothetical protein ACK5O2_15945 [Microthrixaceae bacterium]
MAQGAAEGVESAWLDLRSTKIDTPTDDGFALLGDGVIPNDSEIRRATEVLSAVPRAAAVGWSVRGHQWSTHPRRLRTAIVSPSDEWDITVMRGVREVDCLSGMVLVRRRHLEDLGVAPGGHGAPAPRGDEATRDLTRSMRAAGHQLLYLGSV